MNDDKTWLDMPIPEGVSSGRRRTPAKLDNQYADALEDMRRAFHAYDKAQNRVKRLSKLIDKLSEV